MRRAIAADVEALVALEESAQVHPWTRDAIAEELAHRDAVVLVVHADDADDDLVAVVYARTIGDEFWILQVGTHPIARRQGFAATLIDAALSTDIAMNAASAWLEVRASNVAAIALYASRGFNEVGRRRKYYPPLPPASEREDALQMTRHVRVSAR